MDWLLGRSTLSTKNQTPPIQSSTQTHMDLWNSAMGNSLQFQHRNPPAFSIQDSPINSERTLVHNLLDNSETTHRLERYTVLTLPDRPE
jgi:hypothetical protein